MLTIILIATFWVVQLHVIIIFNERIDLDFGEWEHLLSTSWSSFLMYYGATSCWYRCYAFEQEQSVSFCFVQERSCSCWKYATKKVVFITFYMLVLSHGYKSGYWSVSGFWIYGWKTIGFIEMFFLFISPFICYCFHLPRGWNVVSIHGDKAQQARTAALSLFKEGSCPLMVCCQWNNKILWRCKKNGAIK